MCSYTLNPNLRHFSASCDPRSVPIGYELWPGDLFEKQKRKVRFSNKNSASITNLCARPIPTIFGTLGHHMDIINSAKFHPVKGFGFVGSENYMFP